MERGDPAGPHGRAAQLHGDPRARARHLRSSPLGAPQGARGGGHRGAAGNRHLASARRVRPDLEGRGPRAGRPGPQVLGPAPPGVARPGGGRSLASRAFAAPTRREDSMADQPRTADDVKALVQDQSIRFIRLWFTDILGQLKSFSINAEELDDAMEGGMGFDGSSITGCNAIEESDMIAQPDPTTFAVLPWRPEASGVLRLSCDVLPHEPTPHEVRAP